MLRSERPLKLADPAEGLPEELLFVALLMVDAAAASEFLRLTRRSLLTEGSTTGASSSKD